MLSDVMGRALLVDCDGGWRSSTSVYGNAGFRHSLDVCDIIIRGQSVCIRCVFFFFSCLFSPDLVIKSDHVKMELRDLTCP